MHTTVLGWVSQTTRVSCEFSTKFRDFREDLRDRLIKHGHTLTFDRSALEDDIRFFLLVGLSSTDSRFVKCLSFNLYTYT